ncbi:MAG: neutral zinc metallopeptidase [Zavarzinella sp.]
MRWEGRERSSNVEDRRGMGGKGKLALGGGGIAIVALILSQLLGFDVRPLLNIFNAGAGPQVQQQQGAERPLTEEEKKQGEFASVVLKDTEDVWTDLFQRNRKQYKKPKLVLFTDSVQSDCGAAGAEVGPFYCPADQTVYIDLAFFVELDKRFKAPGDFANAYVIAHEVGHHVQKLLGYSDLVDKKRRDPDYNQYSVRLELQADYLAGVWAHHIQKKKNVLDPGDIDEALTAANAIGDDTLQKKARGKVMPDSFTHGTSAQRVYWFKKGFESGKFEELDLLFTLPYNKL